MKDYEEWRETRKWAKLHPYYYERKKEAPVYAFIVVLCIVLAFAIILIASVAGAEEIGTASYYTTASCQREGTSGVFTATGEQYNEMALTCARPSRSDFGKYFKITNLDNGKTVIVRCNDFGPAKRLVKKGRIIDLSKGAFQKIADLKKGVVRVRVEEYKKT